MRVGAVWFKGYADAGSAVCGISKGYSDAGSAVNKVINGSECVNSLTAFTMHLTMYTISMVLNVDDILCVCIVYYSVHGSWLPYLNCV